MEPITIKCFYADGDTVTTKINASFNEATEHFIGNWFNIGKVDDSMQQCIGIELIK